MIVLSLAEFAAKRRKQQDDAIAHLLPVVEAWLAHPNAATRRAVVEAAVLVYTETYKDEGGTGTPLPGRYRMAVRATLLRSNPDTDPTTLATLLAVTATNSATVQAAGDDAEPLLLEWVTMGDTKVRHTHKDTEGQQRPPGEKFSVGGTRLDYPGQPVGDPAIWINCRCTLAPVLASEASSLSEPKGVAMTDTTTEAPAAPATEMPAEIAATVPWHGVLAPEGKWSGDGRQFAENSLTTRDMPLPLTWQKASSEGHGGSVVVAKISRVERVDGEMRATGEFLQAPEADEVVGMIAEFGRFGVSVDADDAEFEFDEESGKVTFTSARIASASIVSIPAFAEAWVALGNAPADFMPARLRPDRPGRRLLRPRGHRPGQHGSVAGCRRQGSGSRLRRVPRRVHRGAEGPGRQGPRDARRLLPDRELRRLEERDPGDRTGQGPGGDQGAHQEAGLRPELPRCRTPRRLDR